MDNLNLNINFGQLIKNVAVDMHGHQVGAEVKGVYGHTDKIDRVVVLEKQQVTGGVFSYLVKGVENPNYIGHACGYKDGTVLIDNARIIGSDDPQFRVRDFDQARREVFQSL